MTAHNAETEISRAVIDRPYSRIILNSTFVFFLMAFALDCSAQTLADVARQERERKKRLHTPVVVASGRPTTTAASTGSTAAVVVPAAPAGPTDNKGRDEKYWRAQFQKARDDVRKAEERVQLLDLKVKELNTQVLRQSDVYNREYRLGPEIADTQKQLDESRKAVDQAKKKITDLEDELRRSGGLPGWAR
jgi:predicted RNase H-like nuclease (RuvC/YqgF family)